MPVNLQDIFTFYQVAKHLNFSRAAQDLNTSKSYISKSVARLENQLNTQLLQRSTRKVSLTNAGEKLLLTAEKILETLDQGVESLQDKHSEPSGTIKISAPPAVTEEILAPLFSTFMAQYPRVNIEISLQSHVVDIISETYDLAIRSAKLDDSAMIARKISDISSIVVAAPAYLQNNEPITPKDLNSHTCLAYKNAANIYWEFSNKKHKEAVKIIPQLKCNLSTMLKACCLEGSGITVLPKFMVQKEIETGKLQALLHDWALPTQPLYIVYTSRENLPRRVRLLINHLYNNTPSRI